MAIDKKLIASKMRTPEEEERLHTQSVYEFSFGSTLRLYRTYETYAIEVARVMIDRLHKLWLDNRFEDALGMAQDRRVLKQTVQGAYQVHHHYVDLCCDLIQVTCASRWMPKERE